MTDRKNIYLGGEKESPDTVNPRRLEKFLSAKLVLLILAIMVVILWLMKR